MQLLLYLRLKQISCTCDPICRICALREFNCARQCLFFFFLFYTCRYSCTVCLKLCRSLSTCDPEQAGRAVEAHRTQEQGAREGGADVLYHSRPEDTSFLWGPIGSHHHLQHRGIRQSHRSVLRAWVFIRWWICNGYSSFQTQYVDFIFYGLIIKLCTEHYFAKEIITKLIFDAKTTFF